MSEHLSYGQCARCGRNLTRDHECSWRTVEEVVEEFSKEFGPAWDDEIAKERVWVKRQLRKIGSNKNEQL